jgi:cytoskeleton protein RodZ
MSGSAPETPGPAPEALAPAAPSGPGALLRQARERAGIGAEDLAGQLKIAKSTLEALERDDFAALSEPVYVRGYYRKIAKVLGVPESEVIAAYGARSQPAPVAPAMRRIPLAGGVAAGTSRQYRGQGLWIAVGIAVVLALGFALTEREPARRLAPETAAPAAAAPATVAPTPTTVMQPATGPDVTAAVPESKTDTVPPPATAAPDASAVAPTAAPPAAAVPPTQLTLEFSAASFVRVEDSRQRTLAIGLVRGGERQALDGQPPYTVFLGNAQNVKVFYGGGAVDFSSHINRQNDTARFTVP